MNEKELRKEHGDDLVDRALKRKISMTQFGWRVAYDPNLDGEYEKEVGGGRAYWPKLRDDGWRCRCRWGRQRKMCSHVLAVLLKVPEPNGGHECIAEVDHHQW